MENSKSFWINEIDGAESRDSSWVCEAKDAVRIYKGQSFADASLGKGHFPFSDIDSVRYNILFSNTQLLQSAIFTNFPKPYISKRFSQQDDALADSVSEVVERAVSYFIDCGKFDAQINDAVLDYLLPGRGVCWIKYEPKIEGDAVKEQTIKLDYVNWQDFRHSWGKKWADVWWVARRYYLDENDLKEKFGEKIAADVELKYETAADKKGYKESTDRESKSTKFAEVWEVWNKRDGTRIFVSEHYKKDEPLKIDEDPLHIAGFYPLAEPIFSILSNDEVAATPEFRIYFKQAMELNRLAERITYLTDSLRWNGFFDAKHGEISKKLTSLKDNQFLPVDIAGEIKEAGGLAGIIYPMPLNERITAINTLYEKINSIKTEVYEITGISDLMRSVSAESTTATEARIKGTFGSLRLIRRQEVIQRFIRDNISIMAEIIAEHFTLENLQKITGVKLPTLQEKMMIAEKAANGKVSKEEDEYAQKPTWEEVYAVLRSDKLRDYKIDIETTSTAFDNVQLEKAEKNEFLAQMNSLMTSAAPLIQQAPDSIDLVKELVLFGLSSHKTGRNMTENIKGIFDNIKNKLSQQGEQPADPKISADAAKAQAQQQAVMAKLEIEREKMAIDARFKEQEIDLKKQELVLKAEELRQRDKELDYQNNLKTAELAAQVQMSTQRDLVNSNISGQVRTLE